jgi:hypothetical protein
MFDHKWGQTPDNKDAGSHWGRPYEPKPKRNFWGDLDGDGKETAWDDVLGDGLLMDALAAQQREQRGDPPEPEDEWLIGRRYTPPTSTARASGPGAAGSASGVAGALLLLGLAMGTCALLLGLMR